MKVTFIITGLRVGGAETVVCNLIDILVKKKIAVSLIVLFGKGEVTPKENINIIYLNITKKNIFSWLHGIFKFISTIKKIKPDVIHSHMFHAIILSRLLKPFLKCKKIISSFHNNKEQSKLRMYLYRLTDSFSSLNTNVSNGAVNDYLKYKICNKDKIKVKYNGIYIDDFIFSSYARKKIRNDYNLDDNDILIINIGRFTQAKGHVNLISAFKKLTELDSRFKLLLLGDGELKLEIANLIEYYNLNHSIFTPGFKKNISEYLSASDVFVLSSRWEGFGLVLAEAMACKLPVITTNVGGTNEVVANNGFYSLTASSDDLYIAINSFFETDKAIIELIKNNAYEHVKSNFNIENIGCDWIRTYRELLK